jgi:hypothetical protein
LATLAILWLWMSPQVVRAEDCSNKLLNTYEHANCEQRNEAVVHAEMDRALDRALNAATALLKTSVVDFGPQIKQTQVL